MMATEQHKEVNYYVAIDVSQNSSQLVVPTRREFSDEGMKRIRVRYKKLIKDKVHAM
jgi:hypothetical protein